MDENKKLGLPSVIATGVGVIVATSCLLSLGQGAGAIGISFIISMALACLLNCLAALSIAELNALMPNLTGGLAQYTLTCLGSFVTILVMVGGYLIGNTIVVSVECAMFGNTIVDMLPGMNIDPRILSIASLVILVLVNLRGVDMFAKVQNVVAYGLIGSIVILGLAGWLKLGTGVVIDQPAVIAGDLESIVGMSGLAFFLFIASEFIIPISKDVKNARRNVPLGMVLSLIIILVMQSILVMGFKNYTLWADLAGSATPHILYGSLLFGKVGAIWMAIVSILAVVSSVNSNIAGLPGIAAGMANIELLPGFFSKKNKQGVPYIGMLIISSVIFVINITGLTSTEQLSFMILSACVILMIVYVLVQVNVIILRRRLPKAPRTFKLPFGYLLPLIGIAGTLWMIWNISEDMDTRLAIYKLCIVMFILLGIYAFVWLKLIVKKPLFKPVPLEKVMAMENEKYLQYRREKAKKQRTN